MKYIGYLTYFFTLSVMAALDVKNPGLPGQTIGKGDSQLRAFFESMVSILQDVTAIVSVIGICLVGIMLIMSQGNEEKSEAAKKYMIAILTGVVLAVSAWSIISLIDLIPNSLRF